MKDPMRLLVAMHPRRMSAGSTRLALAFLVLCDPVVCFASGAFDYGRVEQAIRNRNFAWAQKDLEGRLQTAPGDFRAHMLLGIVLDEQNQPAEAAQHFQKAVQLQPRSAAAHINLGKHDARVGDLAHAAAEFEAAIRLDPADPAGHSNLGLVLMAQRNISSALGEFQQAANAAPQDPASWFNLFKCQLELKQFAAAHTFAQKMLTLAPPSAELLSSLGALEAQAGDYAAAIENLNRALALDPHSYETRYNLALAQYHAGNLPQATETLEALRQEKDSGEIEDLLGEILEKREDYLQAVRAFQKAAEMDSANEEYRFDFIYELLAHKNYDAALLVAKPAVHDFPNSLRLNLALGVTQFAKGLFDDALQGFLATARKFSDSELPVYFLGLAGDAIKKYPPETSELVRAYSQRHPEQFWPFFFLGHVAFQAARTSQSPQDLQDTERLLKKSIELNPAFADSHLDLGNVYFLQEQWDPAIREFQKAISLQRDLAEAHFKLYRAYQQVGDSTRAQQEKEIHEKLQQQEAEASMQKRQVTIFLYKLRN